MFIVCSYLHFLYIRFLRGFSEQGPIKYKWYLNRTIWPIDGKLTGVTTPIQSGPGSNGNK